eukprot:SM000040S14873  [mRNA]  locus=s40:711814:715274:+ [translate_table: standard]
MTRELVEQLEPPSAQRAVVSMASGKNSSPRAGVLPARHRHPRCVGRSVARAAQPALASRHLPPIPWGAGGLPCSRLARAGVPHALVRLAAEVRPRLARCICVPVVPSPQPLDLARKPATRVRTAACPLTEASIPKTNHTNALAALAIRSHRSAHCLPMGLVTAELRAVSRRQGQQSEQPGFNAVGSLAQVYRMRLAIYLLRSLASA